MFDDYEFDQVSAGFAALSLLFMIWWVFKGPWPKNSSPFWNILTIIIVPVAMYFLVDKMINR